MILSPRIFVLTINFCCLCSSASPRPARNYKFRRGHGVLTGQEEEEDSLPFYLQSGESDERMPLPMRVSAQPQPPQSKYATRERREIVLF